MAASTWSQREVGRTFSIGGIGELTLADALDHLAAEGIPSLHGRVVPEDRDTIDHMTLTGAGLWVVHTEERRGTVTWRHARSRAGHQLIVRGRNRQALLLHLDVQVREVARVLLEHDLPEVAVRPALCFVGGNVPVLQRQLEIDGRLITWPCAFGKRLALEGPMDLDLADAVLRALEVAFPPAR